MSSIPFYPVLMGVLYSLLSYAVYIVGIVFAVKYWSRAPRVGLIVTVTLSILLLTSAARTFTNWVQYFFVMSQGRTTAIFNSISQLSYIAATFIHAAGLGVILWVLFGLVRELSEKQSAEGTTSESSMT